MNITKDKYKLVQVKFHAGSKNVSDYWTFKFESVLTDSSMTLIGQSANDYAFDDYLVVEMEVVLKPRQQTLDAVKSK